MVGRALVVTAANLLPARSVAVADGFALGLVSATHEGSLLARLRVPVGFEDGVRDIRDRVGLSGVDVDRSPHEFSGG